MIDIKDQVCTREQAEQLFKLGIHQDSYFYWANTIEYPASFDITHGHFVLSDSEFSAFTVAELMDLLPHEIRNGVTSPDMLTIIPPSEGTEYLWCATYLELGKSIMDECRYQCDGDTLAEALAWLLILAIEHNDTTPEQINNRLKTK